MAILDTYGSAVIACSLRLLRTAYSGSAVRVRRSSDSAEQDIGFVSGHFDVASMETFIGANTGFIKTIYDQSGNGNDLVCTETAKQPIVRLSGTTQLGSPQGRVGIKYQTVASTEYLQTAGTTLINLKEMSLIMILAEHAASNNVGAVSIGSPSASDFAAGMDLNSNDGSNLLAYGMDGANVSKAGSGLISPAVIVEVYDTTAASTITGTLFYDNVEIGDRTAAESYGTDLKGPVILGNRWISGALSTVHSWNGPISELIIWNTNREASRAAIYSDLDQYYITGSTWGGRHPTAGPTMTRSPLGAR